MFYTGVGSRKTPSDILNLQTRVAKRLSELGYTLRSGGAIGADTAFEKGATTKEIFYGDKETANRKKGIFVPISENDPAMKIVAAVHPAWARCSDYAKQLHRRNVFQVLGEHLNDPTNFLVCWTPCGAESAKECTYFKSPDMPSTGGTATAIRIAEKYNVPIFNFGKRNRTQEFFEFMKARV